MIKDRGKKLKGNLTRRKGSKMSLNGAKTGFHNSNHITLVGKSVLESSQQSHSLMMLNTELSEKRLLRNGKSTILLLLRET